MGIQFTASGAALTTSGVTTGGNGGAGGTGINAFTAGGNGGAGGAGVVGAGLTVTNSGTIAGGNGGTGGTGLFNGSNGAGAAGIVGTGLAVINSGTISGGLSGDGMTRANAITFTGSTNVLELRAGSTIIGNIVAFSGADTLALGGTTNERLQHFADRTPAHIYRGFGVFQKTGTSTWTLTGTNSAVMPWVINAGTLDVNGSIANAAVTVNSGGTLIGTGTVGPTTICSGGTFAPGHARPAR